MDTQVLIVGAGPTGLVLALWLNAQDVKVRIIDRTLAPGTTSRALAVQARTLELYRQLDLSDAVLSQGYRAQGVALWAQGRTVARLPFASIGEHLTPYSFMEIFPQDRHEQLLIARLRARGVHVERGTELVEFEAGASGVTARLSGPSGDTVCQALYLAGCDGARSVVRQRLGLGYGGGTYRQLFYVADVEGSGPAFDGKLNIDLDEADFLAVFPIDGGGRARLVGTVRDDRAAKGEALQFEDVSRRAMENLKVQVERVNWFSTYHVHHRVTDRLRVGRAFVLGDAAHIHSPAGGQGMNTGIGDAINLAWKLAAVLQGRAEDALLDSFEIERLAFARRLVASTDRAFSLATADGALAGLIRTRLVPALLPKVVGFAAAREFMFRTVSQITLSYRDMPLSEGQAGHVRGGDRLPWVRDPAIDNQAPLTAIGWQAQVYGAAKPGLAAWATARNLPLRVFAWSEACEAAGLTRDALYLLRPDTYVGLVDPGARRETAQAYFDARKLRA